MKTLLDNDLYKFTMMQAAWRLYPGARVSYVFTNRHPQDRFNDTAFDALVEQVQAAGQLGMTAEEGAFLRSLGLFEEGFLAFLADFQLNPGHVRLTLNEGALGIQVEGDWVETILWEVPLLALVSECYFKHVDTGWDMDMGRYYQNTLEKGRRLTAGHVDFIEFGTRRRRSYAVQEAVIRAFNHLDVACSGTSNVHFAMRFGMKPVGTMAHEWIMAHAALHGIRKANAKALDAWREIYGDRLGIALTDTYTTGLFLENIRGGHARQFQGLRHDSECPFAFADRVLDFYTAEGIDPKQKRLVFSDSLNTDKALEIEKYVAGRIPTLYGIGTHFTNDFAGSPALNIVIKLQSFQGVAVAKISDNMAKASGSPMAVKEALQSIANGN